MIRKTLTAAALAATLAAPVHAGGSVSLTINNHGGYHHDPLATGLLLYGLIQGAPDRAEIRQRGRGNSAAISQSGGGNRAVIHQDGRGHSATINQRGYGNRYGVFQFGRGTGAHVGQYGHGQGGVIIQYGW